MVSRVIFGWPDCKNKYSVLMKFEWNFFTSFEMIFREISKVKSIAGIIG
jgi:hypothetical protein